MAIKSHKYIPRSILRHFSERDKNNHYMIYYITSDSNKINARSIKSFNTENGYYSRTNEKILAKEEEEPLGAFIHNFSSQVNKKEISENNIVALRRYLSYQMLRSDFLIEQIKKKLHLQDEIKKIKSIEENWKEIESKLAYYIEHDELEKVKTELVKLAADINVKEYKHCINELNTTIFILNHIKQKEEFDFKSIF